MKRSPLTEPMTGAITNHYAMEDRGNGEEYYDLTWKGYFDICD
jgi:hypothetical protein